MEGFTPIEATVGGALIGIAAVMLMLLTGRIAGVSGIFGGLFFADREDKLWRLLFVAGLVAAPFLYTLVAGSAPPFAQTAGLLTMGIAGLLVGFGTNLGSGCTSGHGICGVSRLSPRSIAATAVFLLMGLVTATVIRPLLGIS